MVRAMYGNVKNIKEFSSLLLASLSLKELSIVGSCVKRIRGSQQVRESPSSSQHSTVRRKRVNRGSFESGHTSLFFEGDQRHNKNPPQFRPIASKNNTTALQRLLQVLKVGTVYKCGFRVGVEIGLKYMSKIYCL